MILNCKVCGGSLKIVEGSSICKCEYCGKEQTLPKTDDEKIINMVNRANHFRQVFEFDKAIEIYERLINDGAEDAEIYWSLVLCKYGIEYVDDPKTNEKIPTCHRTHYSSILDDADYLMALERADSIQHTFYEKEANYINQVQKAILEISNKEDPFDVFICYKESDDTGRRTQDSVLAQDVYYQLTNKGYKVFFSRITLEGKLGQQYEPYIFSALHSSKVMLVIGTKPEYFNAVWVKNEWSRFLGIMHDDQTKLIIPAYRDMDPYDLPDALSYYQALDMSKIGFVQDLIRGIDKVLNATESSPLVNSGGNTDNGAVGNVGALLKRGKFALKDGDYEKAYDYYDQVLNLDAENSEAYLGQALSTIEVDSLESLVRIREANFGTALGSIKREYKDFSDDEAYRKTVNDVEEAGKKFKDVAFTFEPFRGRYSSAVSAIKEAMQQDESWFDYDKNLEKARRFSSDISNEIQSSRQKILSIMQEALEDAEKEEERERLDQEDKCHSYYERIHSILKEKVDHRYMEIRNTYISGGANVNLKKLIKEFETYDEYKDAPSIKKDLKQRLDDAEAKLEILRLEKSDILKNGFKNIKGFGPIKKAKEKALSKRLQDVEKEIEHLLEITA